ncbi:MAG: type II CRISPR-associated endonuclease Cas1 [Planctomycetes bacterium]|nr:type II CRISPR-associated endonuclease Cas1 [Planctomycetota bacterium]
MIKRTIEISREPAHLSLQLGQLVLEREHEQVSKIPCEDLGMVVVDHSQVSYTHSALAALVEHDAVVVVCGKDHLPAGLLLPMTDHSQVVWRLHDQIAVSQPRRKQLWRQIVQAKIHAQANNLPAGTPARTRLLELARTVRSGDVTNHEAQAARAYWSAWLSGDEQDRSRLAETRLTATPSACAQTGLDPEDAHVDGVAVKHANNPFRRDADGEDNINVLLNYGYSILRAAVARAIVMAGLHPAFGLQHCHRSNLFCLADDLMEPLRPLVDARVRDLVRFDQTALSPISKAALLQLLTQEAITGREAGPLMVTLHRYVASLVKCYAGESQPLEIPEYVPTPFDPKSVESATPSTKRSWAASRRHERQLAASKLANRPF